MDIMFLNQAPRDPQGSEREKEISELLNGYAASETNIELCYPEDYPGAEVRAKLSRQSGYNGVHHAMETTPLIRKIAWAEKEGYDAVIQSCTFDPGVEGARLAVHIPVIGLFRTALHIAANLSYNIGVVVPLSDHIQETWRILYSYRMDDFITAVEAHGVYGEDMVGREDELFDKTVEQINKIVAETDAEYIIPLGGALIPYVISPADLEEACEVPIINTKSVGIKFTEMCVDLGMAQSYRTYPKGELTYQDFISKEYE